MSRRRRCVEDSQGREVRVRARVGRRDFGEAPWPDMPRLYVLRLLFFPRRLRPRNFGVWNPDWQQSKEEMTSLFRKRPAASHILHVHGSNWRWSSIRCHRTRNFRSVGCRTDTDISETRCSLEPSECSRSLSFSPSLRLSRGLMSWTLKSVRNIVMCARR